MQRENDATTYVGDFEFDDFDEYLATSAARALRWSSVKEAAASLVHHKEMRFIGIGGDRLSSTPRRATRSEPMRHAR